MSEKSGSEVSAIYQALAAVETMADMASTMYLSLVAKKVPAQFAKDITMAAVTAWCNKGGKNG